MKNFKSGHYINQGYRPLINADKVYEIADISMPSSFKLISDLEKMNILIEVTGGQRSRMYVFDDYIKKFR